MTTVGLVNDSKHEATSAPVIMGLVEVARAVRARGLTAAEEQSGTRAILDWFSATVAGSVMEPAKLLTEALLDDGGNGNARLVPSGVKLPTRSAALINATASHTAELDDIYKEGIYHPGSPTVAAALALAEQLDSSGTELLRAVAVGYEIGDRIAETVNPAHYRFWHTTGTVGTLGAAAAGAELLGLDVISFAHALATATTLASGLQQAFRSDAMSKPLHAGHAAEAGLLAALSAGRGFTGALDALDGPVGFGVAMAENPEWTRTVANLDRPLGITKATVKNHSCCGHTFAAVDAALQLRADGLEVSDIDSIEVRTYTTATKVAGNVDPKTAFEAKFSTSYCVAAAFVLGSVRLRAFEPDALGDRSLHNLAERITLVADEQMEADFPGQRRALVTVTDCDGAIHTSERRARKGDPEDPLSESELAHKFDDLVIPVLGSAGAARLSEALWSLSRTPSVRTLPIGPRG